MDREAWRATIHRVTKSRTQLLAHISLKFFMISRSRKFTMQKDLKSHSSSTAGSYLQPNCIQNFSDKQQLSPHSQCIWFLHDKFEWVDGWTDGHMHLRPDQPVISYSIQDTVNNSNPRGQWVDPLCNDHLTTQAFFINWRILNTTHFFKRLPRWH